MNPANDDDDFDSIESSLTQNKILINNQKNLQPPNDSPEINNNTLFKLQQVNNNNIVVDNELLNDKITTRKFSSDTSVVVGIVSVDSKLSPLEKSMSKQALVNPLHSDGGAITSNRKDSTIIKSSDSFGTAKSEVEEVPSYLIESEIKMEIALDQNETISLEKCESNDKKVMDDKIKLIEPRRIILGEGDHERTERNSINDDEVISNTNNEHIDESIEAAKSGESFLFYSIYKYV